MSATMPSFAGAIPGRHLGRIAPTIEQRRRVLPMRRFLTLAKLQVPDSVDYSTKAQRSLSSMMGNDQQGDCVAVTIAKMVGVHSGNVPGGTEAVASTAEVLAWYHAVGGPGDNGMVVTEALDYARDRGIMVGGVLKKIDGYAALDHTDVALVNACAYLFGGLHIAVALPNDWYQNADDSDVWDVTSSYIVGGHSVPITGYTPARLKLATWARQPHISRRAFHSPLWVDECYAVLGRDWYTAQGIDANGVNVQALRAALAAVAAGGMPDLPPDPNPPAPPAPPEPGSGETLTASGTVNMFGQMLPVQLSGIINAQGKTLSGMQWLVVLGDVTKLIDAATRKDWAAVALGIAKLLADLGVPMTSLDRACMSREFTKQMEAAPGR